MQNKIQTILGMKGSGKTTLAKKLVANRRRLLVLDPNGEYRDGLIFETFDDLLAWESVDDPDRRYICRFESDDEIGAALRFAWDTRGWLIVAEEVDLLCSPASIDADFSRIIRHGRHRQLDLIAVSRRPAEVSKLLTSQSDEIISFRQLEDLDLDYLRRRGFDPAKLAALERFEYLSNAETARGTVQKLTP